MSTINNVIGNTEIETGLTKKIAGIYAVQTTAESLFAGATTTGGSASAFGSTVSSVIRYLTSGVGTQAGARTSSFNIVRPQHDPIFYALVTSLGALSSGIRFWVGLFGANPANTSDASTPHIAFRYSDTDGDTGFIGTTFDGTTQATTASLHTFVNGGANLFKIRYIDAEATAYFSVNGGAETPLSTNLPASTQDLGLVCMLTSTDAVAGKNFLFSRVFCEFS